MSWLRESFAAKLLAALLGTIGLLLLITALVVRGETSRQVEVVVSRAIQNAGTLFDELNELQRQQAARLAAPYMEGRRAAALLDATIQAGDFEYLADQVDYDMQLAGFSDVLLAFTDAEGSAVLSVVGGRRHIGEDPAQVAPIARRLLSGAEAERSAYRLVEGRLYGVTSVYVDLNLRPVGTITFGLPIAPADVERIGTIGGFEACLYMEGRCVVRTPGVDAALVGIMEETRPEDGARTIRASEETWSVRSEPLVAADLSQGLRILAVPLDDVLGPFDRIRRALLVGGGSSLLISALLGIVLSRSLTRPVRSLVDATGKVAAGDYETEVRVTSHDEMRTLADAFNDMTRGLLLRERYRSILNKVVSQDVAAELIGGNLELGGENRMVTVLFADIRGFTSLTEGMEPQSVIGLLNECMEHLSQAIDAEGGVVDKYIGDEVMAVFGAPVTQHDHARRGIRAAARMLAAMESLNRDRTERGERPLGVGIGINTGLAVAGNMGASNRLNYTVVGDVVNLASRLAGQARAHEILISGATLRMAGEGVVASPMGGRSLKGFSAEVEVFSVASVDDLAPLGAAS